MTFKNPAYPLALVPRGGFCRVEPTTAAKIVGGALLVEGGKTLLAPNVSFPYGMKEFNPSNTLIIRRAGLCLFNMGIYAYCLINKGYALSVPFAINSLLWLGNAISALLNNDTETKGPSKASEVINIGFHSAVVISALNDLPWFTKAIKSTSIFALIAGTSCLPSASKAVELWQIKGGDELTPGCVSVAGDSLTMVGVLTTLLSYGVNPVKAIGWTSLAATILGTKNCLFNDDVDKIFDEVGIGKKVVSLWPILGATVAGIFCKHYYLQATIPVLCTCSTQDRPIRFLPIHMAPKPPKPLFAN